MTKELREKLAALRALAPTLNETTSRAGSIVESVEKMLGSDLSLGISVVTESFDYEDRGTDENDQPLRLMRHLAYGRVGGKFCVHVVAITDVGKPSSHNYVEPDWERVDVEETPWSSCPRDIKLESFAKLPELLEAVADRAKELGDQAVKTADTVDELLTAMAPDPESDAQDDSIGLAWAKQLAQVQKDRDEQARAIAASQGALAPDSLLRRPTPTIPRKPPFPEV